MNSRQLCLQSLFFKLGATVARSAYMRFACAPNRERGAATLVGESPPPFRPLTEEEDQAVCEMINRARPDFL